MNTTLMFSSATDEWETPAEFFARVATEFHFTLDAAGTAANRKCDAYLGLDHPDPYRRDGLAANWKQWAGGGDVWLNPPYSRGLQARFIAKAAAERLRGVTTVCLLPARTDTKVFHAHIYDASRWTWREGVEGRLLPGRLKFGGAVSSAPFPSMLVIFRGSGR